MSASSPLIPVVPSLPSIPVTPGMLIGPLALLPLLVSSSPGPFLVSDDDPLLLVQVVIRHADRAPMHNFTSKYNEDLFFRGIGHLSDEGIENAAKMGAAFKKRYVDSGYLDGRMQPAQIYMRSSPVPRVLMSASSFGGALFNRTEGGQARIPPIYTLAYEDDLLLVPQIWCPDGWDQIAEKIGYKLEGNPDNDAKGQFNPQQNRIIAAAVNKGPHKKACKDVDGDLIEGIVAEISNTKAKHTEAEKKCYNDEAKEILFNYISLLGGVGENHNEPRLKRVVGYLLKTVLDNMVRQISCGMNCTSEAKMRVYYTHDINVMALGEVLGMTGLWKGITPEFSSSITLELRSSSHGPYVKLLLKNGINADFVVLDLCKGGKRGCTLDSIIQATSHFVVASPTKCASPAASSSSPLSILSTVLLLLASFLIRP